MKNKDFLSKLNSSIGIPMPGARPPIKKTPDAIPVAGGTVPKPEEAKISYVSEQGNKARIRGPKNRRSPAAYTNRIQEPEVMQEVAIDSVEKMAENMEEVLSVTVHRVEEPKKDEENVAHESPEEVKDKVVGTEQEDQKGTQIELDEKKTDFKGSFEGENALDSKADLTSADSKDDKLKMIQDSKLSFDMEYNSVTSLVSSLEHGSDVTKDVSSSKECEVATCVVEEDMPARKINPVNESRSMEYGPSEEPGEASTVNFMSLDSKDISHLPASSLAKDDNLRKPPGAPFSYQKHIIEDTDHDRVSLDDVDKHHKSEIVPSDTKHSVFKKSPCVSLDLTNSNTPHEAVDCIGNSKPILSMVKGSDAKESLSQTLKLSQLETSESAHDGFESGSIEVSGRNIPVHAEKSLPPVCSKDVNAVTEDCKNLDKKIEIRPSKGSLSKCDTMECDGSIKRRKLVRRNAKKYIKRSARSHDQVINQSNEVGSSECSSEKNRKLFCSDVCPNHPGHVASTKIPIHKSYKSREAGSRTRLPSPIVALELKKKCVTSGHPKLSGSMSYPGDSKLNRCSPTLSREPGFLKSTLEKHSKQNPGSGVYERESESLANRFITTESVLLNRDNKLNVASGFSNDTTFEASVVAVAGSSFRDIKGSKSSENDESNGSYGDDAPGRKYGYFVTADNENSPMTSFDTSLHKNKDELEDKKFSKSCYPYDASIGSIQQSFDIDKKVSRKEDFEGKTKENQGFSWEDEKSNSQKKLLGWESFLRSSPTVDEKNNPEHEVKDDLKKGGSARTKPTAESARRMGALSRFLSSIPKNRTVDYDK